MRVTAIGAHFMNAVLAALLLVSASSPWAAEPRQAWQTRWDEVVAAAKKEGRVVVGGPPGTGYREAVLNFQKAFPDIQLEYTGIAPPQFDTRVARERGAGQYVWDVLIWGFTESIYAQHVPAGWFEPVKPALFLPEVLDDGKWLGGFDAGFMDKGKKLTYAFTLSSTATMYVNRDIVPEKALHKLDDLLDPRWKGKIAWFDPRVPHVGALMLAYVQRGLGEAAAKRLLVEQQLVLTTDQRQLIEWVVRGRYPISIGGGTVDLDRFQKEGLGLNVKRVKFPVEAVTPGYGGVFLMNRAPNSSAAKVFLNWLLSRQGQTFWSQLGVTNSRRLDVPSGDPQSAPDPAKRDRYVNFNSEENIANFTAAVKLARIVIK